MVQLGIDFAGIADAGGFWHTDGGHAGGRKQTILFAGLLLDDAHMMNLGQWKTEFHDDGQTFYVTEEDVKKDEERLASGKNHRGEPAYPGAVYTRAMIGMPEWSFRKTDGSDAAWELNYRIINNSYIPAFALALALTGDEGQARKFYNHDAYFDYADRVMVREDILKYATNNPPIFGVNMWRAYRGLVKPAPDTARWYTPDILAIIDAPAFHMWTMQPRNRGGGYDPAKPIRIALTQPATDLTALKSANVTVTAERDKTTVTVERVETDSEGKHIDFHFASDALRPGRYFAEIDQAAYDTIRDSRGRKMSSNKVTFDVK